MAENITRAAARWKRYHDETANAMSSLHSPEARTTTIFPHVCRILVISTSYEEERCKILAPTLTCVHLIKESRPEIHGVSGTKHQNKIFNNSRMMYTSSHIV